MDNPLKQTPFKKPAARIARHLYTTLPLKGVTHPVFIIGCGRSGTTILGKILANHPKVTYLNEPRNLWSQAYPSTDIWTSRSQAEQGKLVFTEKDAEAKKTQLLRRLFRLETLISNRPTLIEKLPINSFRLAFIREMFPEARFVYLYRNGLEVARSIEKLCEQGRWFARESHKWQQLSNYAKTREEMRHLPALCNTYFEKGLLEWRLSNEAVLDFLCDLPKESFFELSYGSLLADPNQLISHLLTFIGLEADSAVEQFISSTLTRKSTRLGLSDVSAQSKEIGGKLLVPSMDETSKLTQAA